MADVPTSLVGENGIAGREKVITGKNKSLLGEKFIVLTMTQFIQKINKKNAPKNSPTNGHEKNSLVATHSKKYEGMTPNTKENRKIAPSCNSVV